MTRLVRWLVPILFVHLAGCGGDESPRPPAETTSPAESAGPSNVWFRDAAVALGVPFVHETGFRGRPLFPEIMGGGVAILDFDGDGANDIYLVQSGTLYEPGSELGSNRLYRNRGDGTFEDVTAGSGAGDTGYGMGAAVGDYDGDGDPDLFVTNYGHDVLLRNDGNGRFTDVTGEAGVGNPRWAVSAAFADLDADGDLDLYVVNYVDWSVETELDCPGPLGEPDYCAPSRYQAPARDVLYRNEGDGTFTDVTLSAGLEESNGMGLGITCVDFDGDGRIDVFVANDSVFNQLWINQGDGTFLEEGMIRGVAVDEDGIAKAGMGVHAIDYDDDVDRDLLVVNIVRQSDSYYQNDGFIFMDRSAAIGLGAVTRRYTRFGTGFHDFDQDGWLDLFVGAGRVLIVGERYDPDDGYAEPNVLFRGGPDRRLVEIAPAEGALVDEITSSRGAAFGDLDGDGALDVVVGNRGGPVQVLLNVVQSKGHWIRLRPRERTGADALNAVVTVRLGERTITRDCLSAYSYGSASDPAVHLGLGGAAAVGDVTVRWVDGTVETYGRLAAGQEHVLERGKGQS